jgi:Zn-dependent protease
MALWNVARTTRWSTKVVIAAGLLAVLLVAAVPVALFVGLIMMLFGHVVGGLALFGASILAAASATVIASLSGVRYLRKQVTQVTQRGYRVVRLRQGEYSHD